MTLKVTRNHVYPDFRKPATWICFILPAQKICKADNFTRGTESSQICDRLYNKAKWVGFWNLDIIRANAGEAGAEWKRSGGKRLFGYLQTDWFTSKFTTKHLLIIAAFIAVLVFSLVWGVKVSLCNNHSIWYGTLFSINLWSVNRIMPLVHHLRQTSRAVMARNNN